MDLVKYAVQHKTFGDGVVDEILKDKMIVQFQNHRKTFVYPDAFKKHFILLEKSAQKYMDEIINEINKKELNDLEKLKKEERRKELCRKLKIDSNSQAVFGLVDNHLTNILETWKLSTGTYASGNSKGKPRIPKRLNINSVCLLTIKPDGLNEGNRKIIGAFMVNDDFVGKDCIGGIITAHEEYRIILAPEQDVLLFWDYFPSDMQTKKWGVCEMKYCSNIIVKKILEDMIETILDFELHEKAVSFYKYFCDINHL